MALNNIQRLMRKTFILAKLETAYGTAVTLAAADALLASEMSLQYTSNNKARDVIRPYLGASEELVGDDYMTVSFTVEAAGSGTKGTAPAWGKLLRACGMAETIVASTLVSYSPVSAAMESLTLKFHVDGVSYQLLGCRGTADLSMMISESPKIKFTFTGKTEANPASEALSATQTAWKVPQMITNFNTADLKIGGTLSLATGAITGGEVYASRGLSVNLGNSVVYQPMLGVDRVLITDRQVAGSTTLDLSAADEASFRGIVRANTLRSLSVEHGSADGYRIKLFSPKVQFSNPQIVDQDGAAMTSYDLRMVPDAGNDELHVVCA